MAELKVEFAGIEFSNPFILSSAPPAMDAEHIIRASEKGWGGAVTKTIGSEQVRDIRPRLDAIHSNKRAIAMENIELISTKSVDEWCKYIIKIKEKAPSDFVLIASIMGGKEPKDWGLLGKKVEEAGADMIELNISCPHGMPERGTGMFIGQNPELAHTVTYGVKQAVKIPVMVKLTPNVTDIGLIASAAEDGGADALSAINTVSAIIGVDVDTEVPLPSVQGFSTSGGLSGQSVRPIALRCISEIKKASKLPVSGIGGIDDWVSAVEFILMGASTLQLCTAVMLRGFGVIDGLKDGLLKYMEKKGYQKIDEFSGNALRHLRPYHELVFNSSMHAEIIMEKCNGCGLCYKACSDGGFGAISMSNKKAVVDNNICDGCGLCKIVCPFGAVRF